MSFGPDATQHHVLEFGDTEGFFSGVESEGITVEIRSAVEVRVHEVAYVCGH